MDNLARYLGTEMPGPCTVQYARGYCKGWPKRGVGVGDPLRRIRGHYVGYPRYSGYSDHLNWNDEDTWTWEIIKSSNIQHLPRFFQAKRTETPCIEPACHISANSLHILHYFLSNIPDNCTIPKPFDCCRPYQARTPASIFRLLHSSRFAAGTRISLLIERIESTSDINAQTLLNSDFTSGSSLTAIPVHSVWFNAFEIRPDVCRSSGY